MSVNGRVGGQHLTGLPFTLGLAETFMGALKATAAARHWPVGMWGHHQRVSFMWPDVADRAASFVLHSYPASIPHRQMQFKRVLFQMPIQILLTFGTNFSHGKLFDRALLATVSTALRARIFFALQV